MGAGELPAGVSQAVIGQMLEESSDELTIGQRVIRNQVLTRGAPIVGRAAIAIGASAVAGGIALQRKPVTPKKTVFRYVSKKEAREVMRQRKGTHMYRKYGDHYDADYWRRTKHMKRLPWSPQPVTQEDRFRRNLKRKQQLNVRRGGAMRGAGALVIVGGKLLPTLAYGYVFSDMIRRMRAGEDVNVQAETETLVFGAPLGEHAKTALETYSRASIVYHGVVKPVGLSVLRHETGGILG